jgi:hypothetical protein
MRKLTALTFVLSFFAAGQAFAGPPHAPTAHGPVASAARAEAKTVLTNDTETDGRAERQMDRQNEKTAGQIVRSTKNSNGPEAPWSDDYSPVTSKNSTLISQMVRENSQLRQAERSDAEPSSVSAMPHAKEHGTTPANIPR